MSRLSVSGAPSGKGKLRLCTRVGDYPLKGDLARAAAELAEARRLSRNGSPVSIAAERSGSARDFTALVTRTMVEGTYLAGLRRAGVPED